MIPNDVNCFFVSGICYLTVKTGVAVRQFENSYSQGNSWWFIYVPTYLVPTCL